jgi:2-Cys peroxiredoxin 5
VIVFCVNDGAVMTAWAQAQGTAGSFVSLLGDPSGELTKALDLVLDHPGPMSVLGNPRVKRFSALIDNGVVKTLNVCDDPSDPAGDGAPEKTLVDKMLADL